VKANKKTLMAVKRYLQEQEGWDLEEVVSEMVYETKLLKVKNLNNDLVSPDECDIVWDDERVCNLDDFIKTFSNHFIEKVCNVLDSFVGDDIDCYFEDEE